MKHLVLARKIADVEYPIEGKSSERLNNDMVRKIAPMIDNAFKPLEDERDDYKRRYEACLKHLPAYQIQAYNL